MLHGESTEREWVPCPTRVRATSKKNVNHVTLSTCTLYFRGAVAGRHNGMPKADLTLNGI